MDSDDASEPISSIPPPSSSRTVSVTIGSRGNASVSRAMIRRCRTATASAGDAEEPASSPIATAELPQRSSDITVESTSSEAATPRTLDAAPGWNRAPTTVVPGARISTMGCVRGPTMRGVAPSLQTSSMLPSGRLRWV
jgi:hypothetical protein